MVMQVYVDTVGDAGRYQDRLSNEFTGVQFTVCPKADALYPIVSAASIVAKVTRDAQLKERAVGADGKALYSTSLGSGYPGDPDTKAWLEGHADRVFGYPDFVRCLSLSTYNQHGPENPPTAESLNIVGRRLRRIFTGSWGFPRAQRPHLLNEANSIPVKSFSKLNQFILGTLIP